MNPEKEKQEKTLAKLQWLNERVKQDFKGNPSPFETKKTLRTVDQEKKAKLRALAGDTDFLPFWHGTKPLALDATRSDYIECGNNGCAGSPRSRTAYGGQAVDPVTGLTEVQLALSWSVPHTAALVVPPPPSLSQPLRGCMEVNEQPAAVRRDASYMQSLSPVEGAATYQRRILHRPKCPMESSRTYRDRWGSSTQLGEPVARPKRAPHNTALDQQNCVRAVYLLRGS